MELRLGEVFERLRAAASLADAPLCAYVYDLAALRRHATALARSLPDGCELFYAIKANPELPILQTLAPVVDGFEVSSGGELAWVREHFATAPVIFSGPGKLDDELAAAIDREVDCLHVESLHELERLAHLAIRAGRSVPVALRINLAIEGLVETRLMMGGRPTPFGIPEARLSDCLDWLSAHPEIRLRGFHFHLLSHQLDARTHLRLVEAYLMQARRWCEDFALTVDHINVGGGIGINYREPEQQFDWALFSEGLAAVQASCGMAGVRVRLELGRYLTAACGYYAMQVIDIKQSYGETFVVGRGGTHHFRTPCAQGHSHPFHVLPIDAWPYSFARPEATRDRVSVVGQLCTPKDVLASRTEVESVRCNDIVVFPYAGAYAWHISHHDFLRHPHPAQWYLPADPI